MTTQLTVNELDLDLVDGWFTRPTKCPNHVGNTSGSDPGLIPYLRSDQLPCLSFPF